MRLTMMAAEASRPRRNTPIRRLEGPLHGSLATRRRIEALAALLVLAAAGRVAAQEPVRRMSLQEAIETSQRHAPALGIARAERRAMKGEARQSRAYSNPSVELSREDLGREGEEYWETIVAVRQSFEWPGRTVARLRAASRRIESAEAGFRADSLDLLLEVRLAYAEAWAAEEVEGALRRTAREIGRVATAAERRYEAGDISGYAMRRLRLESARAEQALAAGLLRAVEARRRLGALVLPEGEVGQVRPAEPLAGLPPPVARAAALTAAAERPGVRAAERALRAAEAEASAAARAWIPSPTITAGYKDQADAFSGVAVGVALPLPLFDRKEGATAAAAARRAAAAARLDLHRRRARNEVLTALDRYASSRDQWERRRGDLPEQADEMLETARLAYEEGELELVGLLDAAAAFRDARLLSADLRRATWIAYFDLLRLTGGNETALGSTER